MALANADPGAGLTEADVQGILERWGVSGAAEPSAVMRQVQALPAWWRAKWPQAIASAEIPVEAKRADGTIVRGQIDLLLKLKQGLVLVDHKADPRAVGDGQRLALEHGAQLEAYEDGVQIATGDRVIESWLYLPVAAKAVRISRSRAASD
jgi:hypothetical protein